MFIFNSTLPEEIQLEAYQKRFIAGFEKKMNELEKKKAAKKANNFARALMTAADNYLNKN